LRAGSLQAAIAEIEAGCGSGLASPRWWPSGRTAFSGTQAQRNSVPRSAAPVPSCVLKADQVVASLRDLGGWNRWSGFFGFREGRLNGALAPHHARTSRWALPRRWKACRRAT
jgi:hypothetical protein